VITDTIQETHRIYKFEVETDDVGYGKQCRRARKYHAMIDDRVAMLADPVALYEKIKTNFETASAGSEAGMSMIAGQVELDIALKRKCQCESDCVCTWAGQLTEGQRTRLQAYKNIWKKKFGMKAEADKRAFFHLNDNPKYRCVWSGQKGCFPTIRRGMGPVWSAYHKRPVMASELLTSMGWHVSPGSAAAVGVPFVPFNTDMHLHRLVGNAMHLANVTAVMAAILACTPKTPGPTLDTADALVAAFNAFAH